LNNILRRTGGAAAGMDPDVGNLQSCRAWK